MILLWEIKYIVFSCLERSFIETPFQKLSLDIVNKIANGEIIIKNEDEEKENEIKINDEQNSEN